MRSKNCIHTVSYNLNQGRDLKTINFFMNYSITVSGYIIIECLVTVINHFEKVKL